MGQDERIKFLNNRDVPNRDGIAYWMHASVRASHNHGLEYAIHLAHHRRQRLEVFFALSPGYPGARLRHYWFLVQGLHDTAHRLSERGIPFSVWLGDAPTVAAAVASTVGTLVTDRGYTRVHHRWYERLIAEVDCPIVQVESNVVVPVETASSKEEYSAATLRPKIHRVMDRFLQPVPAGTYEGSSASWLAPAGDSTRSVRRVELSEIATPSAVARAFEVDRSVEAVEEFSGGETEALRRLDDFLRHRLVHFDQRRNIPDQDWTSGLSPYLHFGHISPVHIVLSARSALETVFDGDPREDVDSFVEELVVRRELAMNFTEYNPSYDRFDGLPNWAQTTLREHSGDERPYLYTAEQLEAAETDDPYWNACQREMVRRGKMHGYMRMYWGKKILEWMQDPEEAFAVAVALNDAYELDGRDPNGYAGVAWCFGKHDRGWAERPVFGKVRYMNANGLRRKFKQIDVYLHRWRE